MMMKQIIVSAFVALLVSWVPIDAHAQRPSDKRTYFTFSQPITLPGVTLPAGTYLFRLADATIGSRVVQILSEDGTNSHAMLLSIPAQRFDVPDEPEIHFMETASNMPAAVKIWWYPGDTIGHEFIYPEAQARLLASGGGEPVLMTQAQSTTVEELETAELSRVSPSGDETTVESENVPAAITPTGPMQRGTLASPETSSDLQAVGTTGQRQAQAELPQTASLLPLTAIAGTLSLCCGLILWRQRRARDNAPSSHR
jgi:hypothetical protein